jgi:hypothetical protein
LCEIRKNTRDTCSILSEACGGEARKHLSVSEWYKRFKGFLENVEHDEISGRPRYHTPQKKNVEKVWSMVHLDRRLSIKTMAV